LKKRENKRTAQSLTDKKAAVDEIAANFCASKNAQEIKKAP
jgi:hypothetical protein